MSFYPISAKGMTPIAKNIKVVDENNNEYEATYPKRAQGLVKNGRARFIDENTICLVCPPNNDLEDKNMSENKKVDSINNNTPNNSATPKEVAEALASFINAEAENAKDGKLNVNYVLSQIEKIQSSLADLRDALFPIQCVNDQQGCTEDGEPLDYMPEVALQKIAAAKEIVCEREKTLNSMLEFYKKMYDDLTSKQTSLKEMAIKALEKSADDMHKMAIISDALDTIRHLC